MDLKKILDALFTSVNSHLDRGFYSVTKAIEKGDVSKAIENQSKALQVIFSKFHTALSKIENPKIDVNVEMAPLQKQLDTIVALMQKQKELSITPLLDELRAIRQLLKTNEPEKLTEKFDILDATFKNGLSKIPNRFKFEDAQINALLAAITNGQSGGFTTVPGVKSATRYLVDTLTLTLANTEYTYTFPANVVSWTMKMRVAGSTVLYSSASGKFPTTGDNSDYMTLLPMGARSQDGVEWAGVKMYFQSDTAGDVVEFEIFQL